MRVRDLRAKASRAAELTEVSRVRRQRARIEELETAVRENAMLADELEVYVSQVEQLLVPLLERSAGEPRPR